MICANQTNKEERTKDVKEIIKSAKNTVEKTGLKFEPVVLAGHTPGYDLVTLANNPKNKIDHIVVGS